MRLGERIADHLPRALELDGGCDFFGLFGSGGGIAVEFKFRVEARNGQVEDSFVKVSCSPLAAGLISGSAFASRLAIYNGHQKLRFGDGVKRGPIEFALDYRRRFFNMTAAGCVPEAA